MSDFSAAEMPQYRCHKTVRALKIWAVHLCGPGDAALLQWVDESYAPLQVSEEFVQRHRPEAGGYYVVYDDGYASYSPAKAFELGYTKI